MLIIARRLVAETRSTDPGIFDFVKHYEKSLIDGSTVLDEVSLVDDYINLTGRVGIFQPDALVVGSTYFLHVLFCIT